MSLWHPNRAPVISKELIAPKTVTSVTLELRTRRALPRGFVKAFVIGDIAVVISDNDLLPTASKNVVTTPTDEQNIYDHNDATQSYYSGAGVRDIIIWDLGSVASRFVFARGYNDLYTNTGRIAISSDGTTWTDIIMFTTSATNFARYESFRYIKWYHATTSTDALRLFSLEVYSPNPIAVVNYPKVDALTIIGAPNASYQVWEVWELLAL